MNIVEPILYQCRYHPPAAAICAPGAEPGLVSYARLGQFVHNVSRKASALGLSRGQVVAISVRNRILHAAIILGLARLGIITLSVRDSKLPEPLTIDALIGDAPLPQLTAMRAIQADLSWTMGDDKPIDVADQNGADDICRLVPSCGTVSGTRIVALTHRMIFERIARYHFVFGNRLPLCSRTYLDLGFDSSLGFQFLLYMLWRGGMVLVGADRPEPALQACDRYAVQNIVASSDALPDLASSYEKLGRQSNLEMMLSAGTLSRSLSERLRSRMCSHVVCSYGCTETGTVAAAPAHAIADVPGAVGYPAPGMRVEIVDETGRAVTVGAEGFVRVRGPCSVSGYFAPSALPEPAFRDGWFYPGTNGLLTRESLLVLSGKPGPT
jgi:acyl-CoA synthetase (AMP-forming)/AMP-acid ligase II